MTNRDKASEAVWLAICLLTAVMVGATALALSVAAGQSVYAATLTAGGAFGATALLGLAILAYLRGGNA